jgi:pimeloyl-ACP methyl ester carboxylesterase
MVGIDRPGYGLSAVDAGRTIAGWVPEAIAVAHHFDLETFYAVGVSTGGAYALALAALAPARVSGVVACCAMTDMSFPPARAAMPVGASDLWDAPNRAAAMEAAIGHFGLDGSKMLDVDEGAPALAPADMALLADPKYLEYFMQTMPARFAHGVEGIPTIDWPMARGGRRSMSAPSAARSRCYTAWTTRSSMCRRPTTPHRSCQAQNCV